MLLKLKRFFLENIQDDQHIGEWVFFVVVIKLLLLLHGIICDYLIVDCCVERYFR